MIEDCRRIFDFFFSGVEVPEKLRQQFFGWLEIHGNEPETKALLEEYWNEVSSAAPEFDLTEGLEKLMTRLGAGKGSSANGNGSTTKANVNAEAGSTDVNAIPGIRREISGSPEKKERKPFRSKALK